METREASIKRHPQNQASWYSNNPEMAHINDDPSYSKDHYHATWTKPSN